MAALKWSDTDEIGFQLSEEFPEIDPMTIRFTDLRARVLELAEFADDPVASSESALEAIQMAWAGYHRQRKGIR